MILNKDKFDIENQEIDQTSEYLQRLLNSEITKSLINTNIYEEPWSDLKEKMLKKWKLQIDKIGDLQEISGYAIKRKYHCIIIPTILIPLIMTFLSQAIPKDTPEAEQAINITNGAMFLITSGLSGLNALFGYGQLCEKHFSFSSRYSDLSGRIEAVLSSDKKYRLPVDVFITEIKCNLDNLNENSPKIPLYIVKKYNTSFEY